MAPQVGAGFLRAKRDRASQRGLSQAHRSVVQAAGAIRDRGARRRGAQHERAATQPGPPTWADAVGTEEFTVLLVPGVLAELDEQKTNHRNEPVREKARGFSNRIKGWRNRGSLARGVRVQGKVFVRVVAREPDFDNTLSWLDPGVTDDRIVASVLEFQRNNPTTDVRLLSGDSIMLAKADEAELVTGDLPDKAKA